MKILALLLSLSLLTGCSFLEREYSTVEPHSSKFWESEAADILRAESYQDIVNDLLLLIGQHTETAVVRLYDMGDEVQVTQLLDRAITEVQQETALGAYAVEYMTARRQARKDCYEAHVTIAYRRSPEQIAAVVSATSPAALYPLLTAALDQGQRELAVRMGYWGESGGESVRETLLRLGQDRGVDTSLWTVNLYPRAGVAGLIEFVLPPAEENSGEKEKMG